MHERVSPSDWYSLGLVSTVLQVQNHWRIADDGYVAGRAWERAKLDTCPFHPEGGCGLTGLGSYPRVRPKGVRVARFWCPKQGESISLLPSFLAAHVTGTLDELERAVVTVEEAASFAAAVEATRPGDVEGAVALPSAQRWLRRRVGWVAALLRVVLTLVPEHFVGVVPTLGAVRTHLGTARALVALREMVSRHLHAVAAPLGFAHRARR